MAIDPKVYNLFKFLTTELFPVVFGIVAYIYIFKVTDYFRFLGQLTLVFGIFRALLHFYRRVLVPAKRPLDYGKWAIVTGSTSGIGKDFADYLASIGMNLLVISRTEEKLVEQVKLLSSKHGVQVEYLAYDFTLAGETRRRFYEQLAGRLMVMDANGGIGLLINNVGSANEIPKDITEFSAEEIQGMIDCNIHSTIDMTMAVFPIMRTRRNGAIVSISSGSGNAPGPFLAVYSATKAFITQLSRSLSVEWAGSGVDFLVVTPFYVVSNLYKRRTGTIIAPMPIALIKGTLAQLGKGSYGIYEGHGYWMHGFLEFVGRYCYWNTMPRMRKMMIDNRKRFDAKSKSKAAAAAAAAANDSKKKDK